MGSIKEVTSDFRLIAASNKNLDEMTQQGRFRKDLLFRLRTLTISLPPLRERPEDIKELISFYLSKLSKRYGKGMKGLSPEFLDTLLDYDWPGNVRELFNALERATAAAGESPTLFPAYLPEEIRIKVKRDQVEEAGAADKNFIITPPSSVRPSKTLQEHREDAIAVAEQRYLKELMAHTQGNIRKACEVAGLSRSRLYGLLKKYGIFSHS